MPKAYRALVSAWFGQGGLSGHRWTSIEIVTRRDEQDSSPAWPASADGHRRVSLSHAAAVTNAEAG